MVSCVLLSAGYSSRFGSPKALAKVGSISVIEHMVSGLLTTQIDRVLVILGAGADQIKPHVLKHKQINIVYNKNFNLGQTSSFKAGLSALPDETSGIMLLPVDYPFVQPATIDALIAEFTRTKPAVLVPTYHSRNGHPPIFSSTLRDGFLSLDEAQGVNQIVHKHTALQFPVDDEGVVATFNTPQEFDRLIPKFT